MRTQFQAQIKLLEEKIDSKTSTEILEDQKEVVKETEEKVKLVQEVETMPLLNKF